MNDATEKTPEALDEQKTQGTAIAGGVKYTELEMEKIIAQRTHEIALMTIYCEKLMLEHNRRHILITKLEEKVAHMEMVNAKLEEEIQKQQKSKWYERLWRKLKLVDGI